MKSGLYIVNEFDRPWERLIARRRPDGRYDYIHPAQRDEARFHGMEAEHPTPIEDFGIEIEALNGILVGIKTGDSKALYSDGRRRFWQGATAFHFSDAKL